MFSGGGVGTRLVFLGGVGEVGRNMMLLERGGRGVLVDAGVMFPEAEHLGVDLLLPDFHYLEESGVVLEALVLTHAHEDHIGAVPWVLRRLPIPVVGTPFTLGLVEGKLEEHGVPFTRVPILPGEAREIGPFGFRFFAVSHSVPHGVALAVEGPDGVVFHSGDFKLDQTPVGGERTDLAGMASYSGRVDLFLCDATNADRPGLSPSESSVGPVLEELFRSTPGRVAVACFASHVHRVQQVIWAAEATGRKVALVGRSLEKNMGVARELGLLCVPPGLLVEPEEAAALPRGMAAFVCTGSQGEPLSALALVAAREHRLLEVGPGDVVIFSSSPVPGNEPAVRRVVNGLVRLGAEVLGPGGEVHASGHAHAEEIKTLIALLKPGAFVPIHGEPGQLVAAGRLARSLGIPGERVLLVEDGDVLELVAGEVRRAGKVPAGTVLVDGLGLGRAGDEVLRDRRRLARDGMVLVVVAVEVGTGSLLAGPDVISRGFAFENEAPVLEEARRRVALSVKEAAAHGATDPDTMRRHVRETVSTFLLEATGRRPAVIPVVVEV